MTRKELVEKMAKDFYERRNGKDSWDKIWPFGRDNWILHCDMMLQVVLDAIEAGEVVEIVSVDKNKDVGGFPRIYKEIALKPEFAKERKG